MPELTAWENFYVIVGSSAGALTGLTFVVITLSAGRRRRGDLTWGVGTYTTPTTVHFGAVLFVSALLSAPWPQLWPAAILLGACGLGGVIYGAVIARRIGRRVNYEPVGEDWLWYAACPLVAYTALFAAALVLPGSPVPALFVVGGALLLLLFMGIHNAWDVVTYLVFVGPGGQPEESEAEEVAGEGDEEQEQEQPERVGTQDGAQGA
jgi:hypothetical protein